jgi:surface protein
MLKLNIKDEGQTKVTSKRKLALIIKQKISKYEKQISNNSLYTDSKEIIDLNTCMENYDYSSITDMSYLMSDCIHIKHMVFLDTSNVTNMKCMFSFCYNLYEVPLFDTSNVINMSEIFYCCNSLNSIPLFDLSNITALDYSFADCSNINAVPENFYEHLSKNIDISTKNTFQRSGLTTFDKLKFYYRNNDFIKAFIENTDIKSNEIKLQEMLKKIEF